MLLRQQVHISQTFLLGVLKLLNGFYHIPFPDKYRGMYEQPQANSVEEYLAPLKEMFAKYSITDHNVCAYLN
jgi:4-aminobutyrate aminotransferase-like enzyme